MRAVQILDGKALAQKTRDGLKVRVEDFRKRIGKAPGLAVVLVGDDSASKVYVRNKIKACQEVGILSRPISLPSHTAEDEILRQIEALNLDPSIHGILVQLPLPKAVHEERVLDAIRPEKDVDGFHVENLGRLMAGRDGVFPCTPLGVMKILEAYKIPISGQNAVVLGRSNIVGKPMAHLLLKANATVTLCHSKTKDLMDHVRSADLVVAAIGRPQMVKGDWIQNGACVIDVGINRTPDGKLVGDVAFEELKEREGWITPVPGGVGPMTIACLLSNTLKCAQRMEKMNG